MKFGIILQTNKPEHIWNTLRLGIAALKAGHTVRLVLMNEGVEIDNISDSADFDISKKIETFRKLGGAMVACEGCLKLRGKSVCEVAPITHMEETVKMIETSDKVLVFG
ncbi:MAG TPA: DsrE family protein [Candidatus Paceibacterota bacterium]